MEHLTVKTTVSKVGIRVLDTRAPFWLRAGSNRNPYKLFADEDVKKSVISNCNVLYSELMKMENKAQGISMSPYSVMMFKMPL